MMRIAIAGAAGRMGKMLIEAVHQADDAQLVAALELAGHPLLGRDAGESQGLMTGVSLNDKLDEVLEHAALLIDFTLPQACIKHLEACERHGVKMVIGTTGLSAEDKEKIALASKNIAIVFAPNMSVGVNVTLKLLEIAASLLDQDYDIEVIEAHHRHKVDAPSGTALAMGEVIAKTLGKNLKTDAVFAREGHTGARKVGSLGFSTIRGGDIVGDHTVMFAGTGERVEITHRSSSRANYALGSLRACRFLQDKSRGLFDMQAVLGLSKA
ncbi:MAG: 4-hydroxy-tetrahydrodipicolinate reductase [Betaproteobacteria bacterium]|jgi:4-hydroxy-tetrahydrodipicolinate reductase|nr:4-hydroxy-tetrahydrodipicolinate reductase [Pseudomonadota bacterium]NBO02819.1 4-hydroxy-tetrahydrodipicolinate reductase [Betaproteobacteria bacterium]NBO95331.1 4-hydroxy-tetrahydrodipicolinate reductase [Betaproteobacteria bacterium]NBP34071.1 4-hydroxy-tetrahydrodipicolinate reductase [Betaproteobacteria bacterium]NBP38030.1 4-hydroxy-tetrahydrodipicolinate reductase [Betaproteobacteria bacterium]